MKDPQMHTEEMLDRIRAVFTTNRNLPVSRSGGGIMNYAIKICAKNDNSGNPRRGWLVYDAAGSWIGFADEGYQGRRALIPFLPATELCHLRVKLREYLDAKRGPAKEES